VPSARRVSRRRRNYSPISRSWTMPPRCLRLKGARNKSDRWKPFLSRIRLLHSRPDRTPSLPKSRIQRRIHPAHRLRSPLSSPDHHPYLLATDGVGDNSTVAVGGQVATKEQGYMCSPLSMRQALYLRHCHHHLTFLLRQWLQPESSPCLVRDHGGRH
jgi:hypothetical protein